MPLFLSYLVSGSYVVHLSLVILLREKIPFGWGFGLLIVPGLS